MSVVIGTFWSAAFCRFSWKSSKSLSVVLAIIFMSLQNVLPVFAQNTFVLCST